MMSNLTLDKLQKHFAPNAQGNEKKEWPNFVDVCQKEAQATFLLELLPEIKWFDGHFPGLPVLAGVVQTHWAGELARYVYDIQTDFCRIDNLKFQAVVAPPLELNLSLIHNEEKNTIVFRYYDNKKQYSTGKLCFKSI